jgi:putative copper resistance protein D
MDIFALAAIVFKFALYSSVMFSTGAVFYFVLFEKGDARLHFSPQRMITFFASIAMLSILIVYALSAANLTGEWGSMIDPEMLGILWQTPVGTALIFHVIGLVIIFLGLLSGSFGKVVLIIGSVITLASFSQVGHITTISDFSFTPTVLLLIHLVGVSLWVGILLPLYRLSNYPNLITTTASIAHQFGQLAVFFVPILLIAGGCLAYELVGSLDNLLNTRYGQVLLLKLALVTCLLGLAAINKLWFVPALKAGDITALSQLKALVRVEIILILTILMVTAVLTGVLSLP